MGTDGRAQRVMFGHTGDCGELRAYRRSMLGSPLLLTAIFAVLALVLLALAAGVLWRHRSGRVRGDAGLTLGPADVETSSEFGSRATLLQFSTPFCARCPAAHTALSGLAGELPGVVHIEIELGSRPELATRLAITASPTTLVLDERGILRARISGVPRLEELRATLRALHPLRPDAGELHTR